MLLLSDLVGQTIHALVPSIDPQVIQPLKLHGVEVGGIWVESQKVNNLVLSIAGQTISRKTGILFLPYHQISFVLGTLDVPSVSDKAL